MFRVLIIDDEPWSREVVKSLGPWSKLGLQVIGEAEDGNEGLRKIEDMRPDIVVTDMRMPGTDGVELLEKMRNKWPMLKIIVMSGYDDFHYLKQAIRSKAIEYLLKPINPEELSYALQQCKLELETLQRADTQPLMPLFESGISIQRYTGHRERIYTSLLELNREKATELFHKLIEDIENSKLSGADAGQKKRVAADLMLLLEQFLSEQSVTLGQLLPKDAVLHRSIEEQQVTEPLRATLELYERAIDALQAYRYSRNRLDILDVKSYIDVHYQDVISLESIAAQFLISKEHLSRMFKLSMNENLSDYIVRKRMEKARALMTEEGLSIKHAAQLVGYEDIAYFYRVFKKYFGMTPGELRK